MKITKGTIARTIVLALALLNQVFVILGKPILDIDESVIYDLCSLMFTVGAALWAWWKNNSFTQKALKGDAVKEDGLRLIAVKDGLRLINEGDKDIEVFKESDI